ncbi:MAG TPA: substrate-binding domain-containing protein, partial [Flavipsychrobacter sp.]|nr:substrate-binding domain-containing protein [Flavipsychrobacter sp.]
MNRVKNIWFLVVAAMCFASCVNDKNKPTDTLSSGTVDISVDETYKPVIEEQLKVFDSSYPEAKITAHYEPETECFKDFFNKKSRLILVTRQLSQSEKALCEQKQIVPSSIALAKDAIAVIINPASADSMLDVDEIKGILTGTYKKKYTVVFDNEGSSTVRFIIDSLLKGQKLSSNVFAAKGNKDVVDYVTGKQDAIGFVGLSYASDLNDSTNTGAFIKNVKVVSIQNDSTKQFYQPYQAYIALKLYPLTRNLYYIN